jgi:hypothetical protein
MRFAECGFVVHLVGYVEKATGLPKSLTGRSNLHVVALPRLDTSEYLILPHPLYLACRVAFDVAVFLISLMKIVFANVFLENEPCIFGKGEQTIQKWGCNGYIKMGGIGGRDEHPGAPGKQRNLRVAQADGTPELRSSSD